MLLNGVLMIVHRAALVLAIAVPLLAQAQEMVIKSEHFDSDPGWESHNNRIVPDNVPIIKQDFGCSQTHFAGNGPGEIGGRVQRSSVGAWFVDKIPWKTMDDALSASGTFAVKSIPGGGGGLLFGFLNSHQLFGNGDSQSLAMLMIFEKGGGRISVRMHNRLNQTCGNFITPYIPGRYRPTPIRPDGTRYHWKLEYDPNANKGDGQIQFTIQKVDSPLPTDDFEGLIYRMDLPPGFKKTGATFDCFGLTNARKSGEAVEIYFDDLEYSGKSDSFCSDKTSWEGHNNRGEFKEIDRPAAHNFGFSVDTNFAGGTPGEAGGSFWRTDAAFGTYADKIGPLTLDDPIQASGKVVLYTGSVDSNMALGFFSSANRDQSPTASNFLGILVGGPTRSGHVFSPAVATAKPGTAKSTAGPTLVPGQPYDWSLIYDPQANRGNGSIQVTLGTEKVKLDLKPGRRFEGATFDRFGLVTVPPGGNLIRLYVDDLRYTAGSAKQ
jgi:hypothetical protein